MADIAKLYAIRKIEDAERRPGLSPFRQFRDIIATVALAVSIPTIAAYSQTSGNNSTDKATVESVRAECADRLTRFVREMDEILTKDPPSVIPLLDLLEKYFPLKGCDAEEAIKICRRSKYIHVVGRDPRSDIIMFSSATFWNRHSGFTVAFSLKPSGDSYLPYAKVNK